MIRASNLVRSVGILAAWAALSLAPSLPTSAQTLANVTAPSASSSKAATKSAAGDAECQMVSEAAGQSRSRGNMELLFSVKLQSRADKVEDAVVPADGREGVYIGSADGKVEGKKLSGTMRISMFSGDCPVPGMRRGAEPPKGLHLCTVNPGGIIETQDGARIRFDGKGYGLFSPEKYRVSMTMAFATDDHRYQWLTPMLGAMEGEVDLKAGTATWNVYLRRS
jgi:hypothetical protein